jgi:hypothetical protein
MKKKIGCVKLGIVNDDNYQRVNVFFDDAENTVLTVAMLCLDTLKVVFFDSPYRHDPLVVDFIVKFRIKSQATYLSEWDFVEKFYPDYDHCDDIAHANDLSKLVEEQFDDGDGAHQLLDGEYGGDINNPQIKIDYELAHYEIYERAIKGFLNQVVLKQVAF